MSLCALGMEADRRPSELLPRGALEHPECLLPLCSILDCLLPNSCPKSVGRENAPCEGLAESHGVETAEPNLPQIGERQV